MARNLFQAIVFVVFYVNTELTFRYSEFYLIVLDQILAWQ